jgi:hypothetical protein
MDKNFKKGEMKKADKDERLRIKRLLTSREYRKSKSSEKSTL